MKLDIGDREVLLGWRRCLSGISILVVTFIAISQTASDRYVFGIEFRAIAVAGTLFLPSVLVVMFTPKSKVKDNSGLADRAVGELSELIRAYRSISDDLSGIDVENTEWVSYKLETTLGGMADNERQLWSAIRHWQSISPNSVDKYISDQINMQEKLIELEEQWGLR